MLCLQGDELHHRKFYQVLDLIQPGDLLVVNDTSVIPARLFGQKVTAGRLRFLVERVLDDRRILAQVRVSKPPRIGDRLLFPEGVQLEVLGRADKFMSCAMTIPRQLFSM